MKTSFLQIQNWIYRNGRQVEVAMWNYYFANGTKMDVVNALMEYQNEDGGFGHALEADCWNPNSTPITTNHALQILLDIEFTDMQHPIYQGIWNYLNSQNGLNSYGWSFSMPENDNYPHAPWWSYSEEDNKNQHYGITSDFCSFILKYGNSDMKLYKIAQKLTKELIQMLLTDDSYGGIGLYSLIQLVNTVKECHFGQYDFIKINEVIHKKVNQGIDHDTSRWIYYVTRPSEYVKSPDSEFYEENKEITHIELDYLMTTLPKDDVWGINWSWKDNLTKYEKNFILSENWWKSYKAIEKVRFLRNFKLI